MSHDSQVHSSPRRRGCGCLVLGGLGCTSFLFGATLAAVVFAPSLLGGLAASWLEEELAQEIEGRIEIGYADLSWTRPQQISDLVLSDPQGRELAAGTLTLPPMWEILDEASALRFELQLSRVDLRRDAEGRLYLERALRSSAPGKDPGGPLIDWRRENPLRGLDWSLSIDLCLLSPPGPAESRARDFAFTELSFEQSLTPNESLGAFRARLGSGSAPLLQGDLRLQWDAAGRWRRIGVNLECEPIEIATLCEWLGWPSAPDWAGDVAGLKLEAAGDAFAGVPLSLRLEGSKGWVDVRAQWRRGTLSLGPDGALEAVVQLPPARARPLPRTSSALRYSHPAGSIEIRAEELEWPLAFGTGERDLEWPGLTDLETLRIRLSCEAPAPLSLVSGTEEEALAVAGEVTASLALGAEGLEIGCRSRASEREDWVLRLSTAASLGECLQRGRASAPWHASLQAPSFAAGLLDELTASDGLCSDLFGPRVDLHLTLTDLFGSQRALDLRASSPRAGLELRAFQRDGLWIGEGEDRILLSCPLHARLSRRLLGPLLPWFEDLRSRRGRARLEVSEFRLPPDLDPGDSSGHMELDLGEAAFVYAPELRRALELGTDGIEVAELELGLDLVSGRVEYDALPLRFEEGDVELHGSIDLRSGAVDLEGELPMVALFGRDSPQAQRLLGLDLRMPARLAGSVTAPRLEMPMPIDVWRSMLVEGVDGLLQSHAAQVLSRAVGLQGDEEEEP